MASLNNELLNFSPRSLSSEPADFGLMDEERRDNMRNLIRRAKRWWDEREDFRRRRARSRDYRRGHQWQETTTNEDGEKVTEEEYIKQQGRVPWVINQVATATRNLIGQYRQNRSDRAAFAVEDEDSKATEMMNVKRRGTRRWNRAEMLERDQFEEHILSGASGFKVTIDWISRLERNEVEIDPIDQTRIFYNLDLDDRRMKNLRLIGELHDLTPEDLLSTYARDEHGDFDRERAQRIKEIYGDLDKQSLAYVTDTGFDATDSLNFYQPTDEGLARVVEVWTKRRKLTTYAHDKARATWTELGGGATEEDIQRVNEQRRQNGQPPIEVRERVEDTWVVHHMTPRGDVLFEQETPYWHGSHPYVVGIANLLDGETWGLIEQMIDPQRWLNRLVTTIDHGMGVAAKGTLLVPENTIPDDMSIDDFAESWSRQGEVIKIKLKKGAQPPEQITSNAIPTGSFELLQQLKAWIEETSGVTGAQLGQEPPSDTPAMLFQQQIMQSGLTNLDYFETFFETARELDWKTIQCLQQAIKKPIRLSEGATQEPVEYRPEDVRNIRFDISTGSVKDTATFAQIFEEDLRSFLERGYIDFGTYLEMSAHPKAETLLRVLQQRDPDMLGLGATEMQAAMAELQGGETPEGQPPVQGGASGQSVPAGDGAAANPPSLAER